MALLPRALMRRSAISTATRLAVTAVSLVLQDSSGARLDAPGAGPIPRSSDIGRRVHEGPLLASYVSDRPERVYIDLAVRAWRREQRHSHCSQHSREAD